MTRRLRNALAFAALFGTLVPAYADDSITGSKLPPSVDHVSSVQTTAADDGTINKKFASISRKIAQYVADNSTSFVADEKRGTSYAEFEIEGDIYRIEFEDSNPVTGGLDSLRIAIERVDGDVEVFRDRGLNGLCDYGNQTQQPLIGERVGLYDRVIGLGMEHETHYQSKLESALGIVFDNLHTPKKAEPKDDDGLQLF